MIDLSEIKAGTKVRLSDGAVGSVVGSYLSTEGLVLLVKVGDGIVSRNVPVVNVLEIVKGD